MTFAEMLDNWDAPPPDPDMTPTAPPPPPPPPPKILDTSFKSLPNKETGHELEFWNPETGRANITPPPGSEGALDRIKSAAYDAFIKAPSLGNEPGNMSILSTDTQDRINRNLGVVGQYGINLPATIAGTTIGGVSALGAGGMAAGSELLRRTGAPDPLIRDINLGAQVAPAAAIFAPRVPGLPRLPPSDSVPPSIMPTYMQPIVEARQAARAQAAPDPALMAAINKLRGVPDQPPGPIASPTGIEPPLPSPPGYVPPAPTAVTTPAQAGDIGRAWSVANQTTAPNVTMPASHTNWLIDRVNAAQPQPGLGSAIAGPENPISQMATRLEQYRDQPMTLDQLQDAYKQLGDQVSAQYKTTGLTETGNDLWQIQKDLRDRIGPDDPNATDPWSLQRKAFQQRFKMDDLQRIQDRAMQTQNPQTSVQNQIKNMITNDKSMRGYSPEEQEALKTAGESGVMGNVLRPFASRLLPTVVASTVGGGLGSLLGPVGAGAGIAIGALTGEAVREPMAAALRNVQLAKIRDAMGVLGKNVPPPPATGWSAPNP